MDGVVNVGRSRANRFDAQSRAHRRPQVITHFVVDHVRPGFRPGRERQGLDTRGYRESYHARYGDTGNTAGTKRVAGRLITPRTGEAHVATSGRSAELVEDHVAARRAQVDRLRESGFEP